MALAERDSVNIIQAVTPDEITILPHSEKENIANLLSAGFADHKDYHSKISNPGLECYVIAKNEDKIIGFAGITRCVITHTGQVYVIGGFGDLVVDPGYRHLGLGTRVVSTVNSILTAKRYDIGMGFCHPDLVKFYVNSGWIKKPEGRVLIMKDGLDMDKGVTVLYLSSPEFSADSFWFNDDIRIGPTAW